MPALRIDMRKLKDALRLKFEGGQSHQQIADALGISKGVVTKYVGLAVAAALDWKAIAAMDEAALETKGLLVELDGPDHIGNVENGVGEVHSLGVGVVTGARELSSSQR